MSKGPENYAGSPSRHREAEPLQAGAAADHPDPRQVAVSAGLFGGCSPGLGPPVVPLSPFLGKGSTTKIDYRKKGPLMLTSLLEDLVVVSFEPGPVVFIFASVPSQQFHPQM